MNGFIQNMHVYFIIIIIWKPDKFYKWTKNNKQEKITNETWLDNMIFLTWLVLAFIL